MIFRGIASLNEDAIAVLNIDPVVGHCATSERLCQSRYSWGVSDAGLMVDINQAHGPRHGGDGPAFLVVHIGTAHVGDGFQAIHHLTLGCSW